LRRRPTDYQFGNEIDDEVRYLSGQLQQFDWLRERGYNNRIPPALIEPINQGRRNFSAEELRAAIASDLEPQTLAEELAGEWRQHADEIFDAFFARMKRVMPFSIAVHITRYGPGGSYQPQGMPDRPGWAISIKDPKIAKFSWSLSQTIVHETVELLIHNERCRRNTPHWEKEAIVDQFCSSNELQAIYGRYPKQRNAQPLPDDWQTYLDWQPGRAPSWG